MSNIMTEAVAESEDRRKEFRQYLVDGGVLDAVVKAVVSLYACEEKPIHPVDFVRKLMGDMRPTGEEQEQLLVDIKKSVEEQRALARDNQRMRERLQELEPDSDLLATSVVPPELLLEPQEEEPQQQQPEDNSTYKPSFESDDLQMVEGEKFQLSKTHAEPEVQEQQTAEDQLSGSAHTTEGGRSVQSEAVSESRSSAGGGVDEGDEETPTVTASEGGQTRGSEEDVAPLH